MVFARHVRAARRLCDQFASRLVQKTYWAAVEGRVEPLAGTWVDHIRKIPGEARAEIVAESEPDAKLAVLHYRVLAEFEFGSLLEIELETGRTHQIRVQAAARDFTILGDQLYGSAALFGPPTDNPRERAIGLHARSLEFRHPMTRQPVTITAALPTYWPEIVLELMQ
jgi:23S rRNA-/tRNA-specific pseudouridylate synthase